MPLNELFMVIIDKGLLAILLLLIGFWINRKLSEYKSNLEQNLQTKILLAESKLPSFTSLWQITAPTSPTRKKNLNDKERTDLNLALVNWYYQKGNGLYLSNELRELYLCARESLTLSSEDPNSEKEISDNFSKLRTALKNEIGIYGSFK